MIVFLLLFIGLPIAMTLVFGDKDRTIAYWMPMSLMIVFTIWTVISLPCVLMQTKFHVPLYIFIGALILVTVFLIFMIIKRRKKVIEKVKEFFSSDAKKYFTNVFFIIMLVLVLYQAGRATIFTPSDYRDNKTYVALANDIVETDSFYTINDRNGEECSSLDKVSTKYKLSGWYSFEAVLSVICGVNPLIIVYTYLPGIVIILSYLIWWIIFKKFFDANLQAVSMALLVTVILYEFMDSDISNIFLNCPTYGKNITSMIVVPLIIFEWMMLGNKKRNYKMNLLYLALLSCAGCGASNMGFLIIPLEFVILAVSRFIVNKRVDFKTIATLFFANLPVAVFSAMYIFAG